MHLVVIFLRAGIKTKPDGDHRDQVSKTHLAEILFEADNKCHYQEVREIEHVLTGLEPLHIVHDHQVEIQVENRYQAGKLKFSPEIEVISDNEYIGGAEIDQCADVEAKNEIGDNANEMRYEDEQDELVEPDRLFPLGMVIVFPQTGIYYILIEGLKKGERVTHRIRIRVFYYSLYVNVRRQ